MQTCRGVCNCALSEQLRKLPCMYLFSRLPGAVSQSQLNMHRQSQITLLEFHYRQ